MNVTPGALPHECATCGREIRRYGRYWRHPNTEGLEPHEAILTMDVELWQRVRAYQEQCVATKLGKRHVAPPPPLLPAVEIGLDELHRSAKSMIKAAAGWEWRAARSIGPWVSVAGDMLRWAESIQVAFKRDEVVVSALWLSANDPLLDSYAFEFACMYRPEWRLLSSPELRKMLKCPKE